MNPVPPGAIEIFGNLFLNAFWGFLWQFLNFCWIKFPLCLRRAFSPYIRIKELDTTIESLEQYLVALRAEYGALNTRHLKNLMYKTNITKPVELKASEKWIYILEMICNGETYNEIAQELSISQSGVVKALEKMKDDNNCFDTDELVILYIN